ncbi:hypothetical protein W02_10490 [Nitrospira sp. KM1]|uniref:non-ribosomal peptide synthetase n=1 Tax=Nitrospira sp. KM1 TaxID=1936990 RepID=UPI0013A72D98|nr:non-ribosomal peptide synthetase [Nitrospira sp. KM1]BCA53909.1 hypothetical protein W02_10490 [Nitrospira sp. KM1]
MKTIEPPQTKKTDAAKSLEAIYPLSPMQEGMLFHTLMNPGTGIYLMQNRYYVEGHVDPDVFRRAWAQVIARHPILRTSFVWKSQKRPLQAVHKAVDVPLDVMDWRGECREQQIVRLDAILQDELHSGFDFAKAPLMRLRLIRLTDQTWQFVHSFHHILLDEWCISPLLMDFLAHYEACAAGRACEAEAPRPYRDYIAWLQTRDMDAADTFWRDYLLDFRTPTPLAYDRAPEGLADQNEDAADHCLHLSAAMTARLTALAQQHRLTPNTFVQGAWAILLSAYSGERDVLFGVTVAGRPTELIGVESVLGLFINTLPLRVPVAQDCPVLGWLKDLLAENVRLRQFEYTPLVRIQRSSEIPRGEALFHSLFVFENAPVDPALCEGRIMFRAEEEQYRVHTNYPMTVMGWPGRELGLKLSYDRRLFDSGTVLRMIGHLKRLLEGIIAKPDARIGELPMLASDETTKLLTEWNAEPAAGTDERNFAARFEAQVCRTPDSIAVSCEGEEPLRYAELNRRANRIASSLIAAGVAQDTIVAVLDERGVDLVTMILGIFKAGSAYLPLDPRYPDSRMARVLELSGVPVVVTSGRLKAQLERVLTLMPESVRPAVLSLTEAMSQQGVDENPERPTRPDQLAYIIYTSGSTGVPKGAMVTQRGMLNNMESKLSSLRIGSSDVLAQTASQCFDISVWQLLTALLCGARTHVIPDDIVREPARLLPHLENARISLFEAVPAVLQALLDLADDSPSAPELSHLRWVLPTGEALPPSVCRQWFARYPEIPLMNAYGPAECADDVAVHAIDAMPASDVNQIPIGRPIQNISLYIVNRFLALVPPGVPGELCVGGVGVGRGYLRDCVRTAESFVPNPFGGQPGARLYRTGDLARYLSDGTIEYLGRLDHQVKIRGFRIELGEIETHVDAHPSVREAAVIVREDRPGDKRLVAYVAGYDQQLLDIAQVKAALQAQLPDYMVPAIFVTLETLPRTPNGKVDRAALPAPDAEQLAAARYVPPRSATEELLAGIWADILGAERVGVEDNFFELGGHSLLATQVVSRIRSTFQIDMPLRTAFECPTVSALALVVDEIRAKGAGRAAPPLTATNRSGPAPLSFAQQRLWFLAQLDPESWFYNLSFGVRIEGHVDVQALRRAFEAVVGRHDILRARFTTIEGQLVQVVVETAPIPFETVAVGRSEDESLEACEQRLATDEAQQAFDLERGVLWRARLFELEGHRGVLRHVLIVTFHHAIADGWSLNLFLSEMITAYVELAAGRAAGLPAPALQYADYARWQRDWLKGDVLEQQLDYWKQTLAGAPALLSLPTDFPRPAVQTFRGARHAFTVPPSLTAELQVLGRRHGATLFMTLLAAFQLLLHRYSGETDLSIGTPVANRTSLEVEELIGFFVNTLVLRTNLSGDPRFVDLLERVREVVLGAQNHQDVPFEHVVDALRPARNLSHSPLFQVMFALQTLGRQTLEVPDLKIEMLEIDPGSAKFDLSLEMTLEPGGSAGGPVGLTGFFEYNTDLFEPATIARMAQHFQSVLESVVAKPQQSLAAVAVLGREERAAVVAGWNATGRRYAERGAVPEQIAAQAARTPEAVAVRLDAATLTYAELLAQANQVAWALRERGVGPEMLVGIAMERSLDLVVGLLGVLQAGAAYVPLDPSYPPERLAYMLEDSAVPVVLTQAAWQAQLPYTGLLLCLDRDRAQWAGYPTSAPPGVWADQQLAYLIYTSGSTGQPKGAGNTHGGFRNRLQWMQEAYGLTAADRVLQKTPISFDVSVWEFFWPLMVGAELVLAAPGEHKEPARLIDRIVTHQITTLHFVPPMLQALVETAGVERCTSVRQIVCSGETLPAAVVARAQAVLPGATVHNLYGPTEAAIDVTAWRCPVPAPAVIPIGRPIANTQIYVLDRHIHPVPVGVAGELYIGGEQVGRGYHGRPGLTAERFVPDALGAQPGQRLYRTGDQVRWRVDGTLEYLGRLDHQVKLRGFRIELGEIEAALLAQPGIREAVVVVRTEATGTKRLVGYVTGAGAGETATLRQGLAQRVPEYMVPAVIIALEQLPLSPNGKVDRKALPAPEAGRATASEPPATQTEARLAAIWAQVLGLVQVGRHDNFFELGGDSILVLQVISRAREAGLSLTPRHVFQHQTVAELSRMVDDKQDQTPQVEAEQGAVTGTTPLTPAQRWFFEQAWPHPHHWNQSILVTMREVPERAVLEPAIEQVLAQHDGLRTRFMTASSQAANILPAEDSTRVLSYVNLSDVPAGGEAEAVEQTAEHFQCSLHLSEGPVFKAAVFDLGKARPPRLLLVAHHLVIDGVSWRILLEDLQNAYLQQHGDQIISLPPKTTSVKYWAERLEAFAQSDRLKEELHYWTRPQQGLSLPLPVDDPAGIKDERQAQAVSSSLSEKDTTALLREVPAAYQTQISDVLLAALVQTFAEWTGRDHLRLDLEGHGREELFGDVDVSRTVGWFTSIFPVVLRLPQGSLGDVLKDVKEQLRDIPSRGTGYGVLHYLSKMPEAAELRTHPPSQLCFNYLGQIDQGTPAQSFFSLCQDSPGTEHAPSNPQRYELTLQAEIVDGRLGLTWVYGGERYRRTTIESLAASYQRNLCALIAHCSSEEAGGYTPSDFPDVAIEQGALDAILEKMEQSHAR